MNEDDYTDKEKDESEYTGEKEDEPKKVYREVVVERVREQEPNNSLGVVSLVTGIIGLVMFFCCFGIDIILAIIAIITGILGYKENQQHALAGMILGLITLGLYILVIAGIFSIAMFEGL